MNSTRSSAWFSGCEGIDPIAAILYPAILAALAPDDFRALGEQYLRETRAYRSTRPFFIDKMPNNFRHIGLIHLILPNARIIDVRREPLACCASNLKQLFASGQEFTCSVEDIARYYRTYLEVMRALGRRAPGASAEGPVRGCRGLSQGKRAPLA